MHIAAAVIALAFSLIILGKSCAANFAGSFNESDALKQDAGIGVLAAIALIIGGGLAFKLSRSASIIFAFGGVLVLATATGESGDPRIWGGGMLVLAAMSFFGSRKMHSTTQE